MKPLVNAETCLGCGTCESVCPEVFKVEDAGGKMVAVVKEADYEILKEKIDEAVAACPVQAITWE